MQQNNENTQQQKNFYLDQKDFLAEWMFNPDIHDDADYRHLDKNLALTRLSSRYNEPERARAILEGLHTLTRPAYYYEEEVEKITDYQEEEILISICNHCQAQRRHEEIKPFICECNNKVTKEQFLVAKRVTPIIQLLKEKRSYYPRSFHNLKAQFMSLTTTASARDGHLLRAATTTHLTREESIQDKTAVKSRWGMGSSDNKNKGY